jgi:hypothetical protein
MATAVARCRLVLMPTLLVGRIRRKLTALDAAAHLGVSVIKIVGAWQYQTGPLTSDSNCGVIPDVAGTVTTMAVRVQDEAFAVTVPNFTEPGAPKPVPRIVILVPATA